MVVFAGDHGVTAAGVSAFPAEVTAQMVANFDAGGAAINVLAEAAGASVRVADIAVDVDEPLSPSIGAHKVRRSSGNIAVEDALTADEAQAAIEAGRRIADEEVDAGADLLIAGDMGIGNTTAATALIAALTGAEPVAVVGRGTGIDDAGWSRKTAAVRDALYRARGLTADPLGLLRVCGGADLAAMAGFCAQAAVRRTPVLLDGVVVTAAAMVAERARAGRPGVVAGGPPVHRARAHAGAGEAGTRADRRPLDAARRRHRRGGRAAGRAGRGGHAGVDGHVRRGQRLVVIRSVTGAFAFGTVLPLRAGAGVGRGRADGAAGRRCRAGRAGRRRCCGRRRRRSGRATR